MSGIADDMSAPRIDVNGAASPALFAVKVPAGPNRLPSVSIPNGNMTWVADIDCVFDAAPATGTYVGDVRLQIDSEKGLFGIHVWKSVEVAVRENRALLDELMRARFPGEHPDVRVALASRAAAGR